MSKASCFHSFLQVAGSIVILISYINLWTYFDELSPCRNLGTLIKAYLIIQTVFFGLTLVVCLCACSLGVCIGIGSLALEKP